MATLEEKASRILNVLGVYEDEIYTAVQDEPGKHEHWLAEIQLAASQMREIRDYIKGNK